MRTKIIRWASALIKVTAAVSAATAYFNPALLPARFVIPAMLLGLGMSALKDFLIAVCDLLDDGQRNNSFDLSKLPLIALLGCCLALVGCAQWKVFAASPLGQTAAELGKALAKATELRVIEQIITKAEAQMTVLKAEADTGADLGKELMRQSEIIGLQGVIDAAQGRYVGLTGGRFVVPKQPLASMGA